MLQLRNSAKEETVELSADIKNLIAQYLLPQEILEFAKTSDDTALAILPTLLQIKPVFEYFRGVQCMNGVALDAGIYSKGIFGNFDYYFNYIRYRICDNVDREKFETQSHKGDVFEARFDRNFASFYNQSKGILWSCNEAVHHKNLKNNFNEEKNLDGIVQAGDLIELQVGLKHVFLYNKTQGTLYARGLNSHGQLGLGNTDNSVDFVKVNLSSNFLCPGDDIMLALGEFHTIIYNQTCQKILACGNNSQGQLGLNDAFNRFTFSEAVLPAKFRCNTTDVIQLKAFSHCTIFFNRTEQALWFCGNGGQLRQGAPDYLHTCVFTQVELPYGCLSIGDDAVLESYFENELFIFNRTRQTFWSSDLLSQDINFSLRAFKNSEDHILLMTSWKQFLDFQQIFQRAQSLNRQVKISQAISPSNNEWKSESKLMRRNVSLCDLGTVSEDDNIIRLINNTHHASELNLSHNKLHLWGEDRIIKFISQLPKEYRIINLTGNNLTLLGLKLIEYLSKHAAEENTQFILDDNNWGQHFQQQLYRLKPQYDLFASCKTAVQNGEFKRAEVLAEQFHFSNPDPWQQLEVRLMLPARSRLQLVLKSELKSEFKAEHKVVEDKQPQLRPKLPNIEDCLMACERIKPKNYKEQALLAVGYFQLLQNEDEKYQKACINSLKVLLSQYDINQFPKKIVHDIVSMLLDSKIWSLDYNGSTQQTHWVKFIKEGLSSPETFPLWQKVCLHVLLPQTAFGKIFKTISLFSGMFTSKKPSKLNWNFNQCLLAKDLNKSLLHHTLILTEVEKKLFYKNVIFNQKLKKMKLIMLQEFLFPVQEQTQDVELMSTQKNRATLAP